uniref:High mobility group protein B2 n=1 Tax=Salmo salar TaxID=8030 RepID=B5XAP4_SALSA|nr:High mobility group protein B2 [Salmo salar]
MPGKDPNKPKGKTSSYAFFVATCREEHKKKHPGTSVNFSEFSKKCSERWRTMSAKEKVKFEDMAKGDKVRYDKNMKGYVPPRGHLLHFSCSVLNTVEESRLITQAWALATSPSSWVCCGVSRLPKTSCHTKQRPPS